VLYVRVRLDKMTSTLTFVESTDLESFEILFAKSDLSTATKKEDVQHKTSIAEVAYVLSIDIRT
jgi:hypothetical protein